ncbi:Crp/Fnr family transcriptional regulator [Mesorhizobium sp. WSM2239]|uniref:Crp/Fnr family transcriptional regulator n=2 Tax=unclassified Mesorhizobium TaxID=325217 RepID=A0AAU8DFP1_9HYPH
MSADDLAVLNPHLEPCSLPKNMYLERQRKPVEFAYFPEEGIASTVAKMRLGRDAEVGVIGYEGMIGTAIVMTDDRSPHDCYMQLAGRGHRIASAAFTAALTESSTLRPFLLRFTLSFSIQASYTALVNVRCSLEQRLSRWLLMCHDRVPGDTITITHEFLSIMLGVRRPGVTTAIHILEGKGLIRATRGNIVVRDRENLIALADGGYSEPKAEYERLIGRMSPMRDAEPRSKHVVSSVSARPTSSLR